MNVGVDERAAERAASFTRAKTRFPEAHPESTGRNYFESIIKLVLASKSSTGQLLMTERMHETVSNSGDMISNRDAAQHVFLCEVIALDV